MTTYFPCFGFFQRFSENNERQNSSYLGSRRLLHPLFPQLGNNLLLLGAPPLHCLPLPRWSSRGRLLCLSSRIPRSRPRTSHCRPAPTSWPPSCHTGRSCDRNCWSCPGRALHLACFRRCLNSPPPPQPWWPRRIRCRVALPSFPWHSSLALSTQPGTGYGCSLLRIWGDYSCIFKFWLCPIGWSGTSFSSLTSGCDKSFNTPGHIETFISSGTAQWNIHLK